MNNDAPELSRLIKTRTLPSQPVLVTANEAERGALAQRFGVVAIEQLEARITLEKTGAGIAATGPLKAFITQSCAVSGEDFATSIDEQLDLVFVEDAVLASQETGETNEEGAIEVDLCADEADEIGYRGDAFDLGEAVAQSLGLAIDPYAEGPGAEAARAEAGLTDEETPSGPLASALSAALKKG